MTWRAWAALAVLLSVFPLPSQAQTPEAMGAKTQAESWPVALTFDDGPHPRLTAQILDILERHHVVATFFVVGRNAAAYPHLLQRMASDGDAIGNHTWDHAWLTRLDQSGMNRQIERTNTAIQAAVPGYVVRLLRPPYGAINALAKTAIWQHGLAIVNWSADDQDYRGGPAAVLEHHVLTQTGPGGVVLMHDIHPNTVAALAGEIEALKKKGFRFVTVLDLLDHGPIVSATYPSPRMKVIEPAPHPALTPDGAKTAAAVATAAAERTPRQDIASPSTPIGATRGAPARP